MKINVILDPLGGTERRVLWKFTLATLQYQCNLFSMCAIHKVFATRGGNRSSITYSLFCILFVNTFLSIEFFSIIYIYIAYYYSTSMIYDNSRFFSMENVIFFKGNCYFYCTLFFPFHVYVSHSYFYTFFPHTKKRTKRILINLRIILSCTVFYLWITPSKCIYSCFWNRKLQWKRWKEAIFYSISHDWFSFPHIHPADPWRQLCKFHRWFV